MDDTDYVVEMRNVRKAFPGIVANDDITLCLKRGEVHPCSAKTGRVSRR